MYTFTKNDFLILKAIQKRDAKTEMLSATIKTISEDTKLSAVKIRATLSLFIKEGYIKEGFRKVNAKTFYITESGIKKLNEIMGGK